MAKSIRTRIVIIALLIGLIVFLGWRFIRPLNIFVVDDRFAWPIDTSQVTPVMGDLTAKSCANCHQDFYDEWRTTIHSQAWTDPYFQVDWQFDGSQHACRLCHTPLDRQLPYKVLGYRDVEKWDPILVDNPEFDPGLQHEGVTCAACHYREGKIVGVLGNTQAPHPIQKLDDPNQVCVRCHIVEGERWDTFFRFPPCGTVAEIKASRCKGPAKGAGNCPDDAAGGGGVSEIGAGKTLKPIDAGSEVVGDTGEVQVIDTSSLGCVECHMPLMERPLVKGGPVRQTRQHLWRGGHDPAMVKQALTAELVEQVLPEGGKRSFVLTLTNTGAAHYLPTGTPDRHLTVQLRLLDQKGEIIDEQNHTLKRTVMWRPFIVDLWDNRLPRWAPRRFHIDVPDKSDAVVVQAVVNYHLLDESRRKRIGYENKEPISYEIFRQRIALHRPPEEKAE